MRRVPDRRKETQGGTFHFGVAVRVRLGDGREGAHLGTFHTILQIKDLFLQDWKNVSRLPVDRLPAAAWVPLPPVFRKSGI